MNAKEVAAAIRGWAAEHNVLQHALPEDEIASAKVSAGASITAMKSSLTKQASVFERNHITGVAFNLAAREVIVLTTKPVAKKSAKLLPKEVVAAAEGSEVTITFRYAKATTIGNETPDLPPVDPHQWVHKKRYTCGSSISVANNREAGTLGCLVRDKNGALFGLTNNHVTGGCNNTRVGTPILAPGVMDVSPDAPAPFTIGFHHSAIAMHQGELDLVTARDNIDVALFSIADEDLVTSMQSHAFDTPSLVGDIQDSAIVEKIGRTSGRTSGRVDGEICGAVPVMYEAVSHHSPNMAVPFSGRVFFEPVFLVTGLGAPFSEPGDSGSLVTSKAADGSRMAVGLVFAGLVPNESYVLPLKPILARLKVKIVSGHNS